MIDELLIEGAERGLIPDALIRLGIRQILARRLRDARLKARLGQDARHLAARLRDAPITVETRAANRQHYEVPTEFFLAVLGRHLKYSCGLWPERAGEPDDEAALDESERAMLALTVERAEIEDGMRVLDLGCGWGSFTLHLAERLPRCEITAVSNSATQRAFIEGQCRARGLDRVRVVTSDVAAYAPAGRFDRVVSVEMLEHVRNHRALLRRVNGWLAPGGKLFVHIFCHREHAYLYEDEGSDDWMSRHFFTGGMMPSYDWLPLVAPAPELEARWQVSGRDYARTCNGWLARLDARRGELTRLFARAMPAAEAAVQLQRWRMFFMACAELFDYRGGAEWLVGHYRFRACADRGE